VSRHYESLNILSLDVIPVTAGDKRNLPTAGRIGNLDGRPINRSEAVDHVLKPLVAVVNIDDISGG
jgi:hypothetical protein